MRALRRIATPASIAAVLSGCTYGFDEYLPRATDAGLTTNQDSIVDETPPIVVDSGVFETASPIDSATPDAASETPPDTAIADTSVAETTADTFVADTAPVDTGKADACACVKFAGSKCKDWSPPGCGD